MTTAATGWLAGARAASLPAGDDLQAFVEDGVPQGRAAAEALLAHPDPPTALVCASDSLALGALSAVPTLAVIGFDDTPVARAVGLTSVEPTRRPRRRRVPRAGARGHRGRAEAPQQVLLAPSLTVRPSTTHAPAPAGGNRGEHR